MTHDVYIESGGHAAKSGAVRLFMVATLLGVIALLSTLDLTSPSLPQTDGAAAYGEDWHGNVRRSHWASQ